MLYLEKYRSKKKLGRGAFGEVLLVQDQKTGQEFAMKLITLKMMKNQPQLMDYLNGEIQCLKALNSPYIMKLFQTDKDQNYQYMVCEFCNGGDLVNYQAKQPNKVFTLQKATQVLSKVINGLEFLHSKGYLHRDIKAQNILVKQQNGKQEFKLADFGFSKKSQEIGGTILGTDNYMSPEIYSFQSYGFEVDMWAFAVLFYFMLNMQFPFKLSPYLDNKSKQKKLKQLTTNFSYKQTVMKSKKQLIINCTDDVEDLFKTMFDPNADQRINFFHIRGHHLFEKYFPSQQQFQSKIIYANKFKGKQKIPPILNDIPKNKIDPFSQDTTQCSYIQKKKDKSFPLEKQILQRKKDQMDFLRDNAFELLLTQQHFKIGEKVSLVFNLLKYYIVIMRNFIHTMTNNELNNFYPKCDWKNFSTTTTFKKIRKQYQQDLLQVEVKFSNIYQQCQDNLNEIKEINPKFISAFQYEITQKDLIGPFKQSYRKSTNTAFNTMRVVMKSNNKGNKYNYILCIVVISHVFNHIFQEKETMALIFKSYFEERKKTPQNIDYSQLREWMSKSNTGKLNEITKLIIKSFFS